MTTKKLTVSLAAASAIGAITVGAAVANASVSGSNSTVSGSRIGFLVIRNDRYARLCVVRDDKGTGTFPADPRHAYGNLTAARPFDYLGTVESSIHFGIVTNDVAAVSLVQPDKSVVAAVVRDGTFVANGEFPEDPQVSTTNYIRATLKNGQVIEGPFRTFVGGGIS